MLSITKKKKKVLPTSKKEKNCCPPQKQETQNRLPSSKKETIVLPWEDFSFSLALDTLLPALIRKQVLTRIPINTGKRLLRKIYNTDIVILSIGTERTMPIFNQNRSYSRNTKTDNKQSNEKKIT